MPSFTFEQYLAENSFPNKKTTTHMLQVRQHPGGLAFYIHPAGVDGDTRDFIVLGNFVMPDPAVIAAQDAGTIPEASLDSALL